MNESPDPHLERSAEAVADAEPLDWEREASGHPELRDLLEGLRSLARLAAAHRQARAELTTGSAARAEASANAAETEPPAFIWGMLRVLTRLGAGSFGEVWRAYDPSLHREVALKLRRLEPLPEGTPALALTSDPSTRRSLEEARKLARVRHPNVLTVFGAAEHGGRVGMWTEMIRGQTLEDWLAENGPMPPREVAMLGSSLCSALAAVHANQLIHNDIKAANVMLEPAADEGGRPRFVLMDFGAAHERRSWTGTSGAGTPLAMAPEVLAGGAAGVRSDVYAVGALLHRLLTGSHVVEAATLEELRAKHARGEGVPLARVRAGVPPRLARIIEHALAPDPAARFAGAEEMRRDLVAYLNTRSRRAAWLATAAMLLAIVASGVAWVQSRKPSVDSYLEASELPGEVVPGLMTVADTLTGDLSAKMGWAAAGCGDVNHDGCDDFLIGSSNWPGSQYNQGRLQLYLGSKSGRFGKPVQSWAGKGESSSLPLAVAGLGDLDGDGYPDMAFSECYTGPTGSTKLTRVSVLRGNGHGFEQEPFEYLGPMEEKTGFGYWMAMVGDVNGDGYPDLLMTALRYRHEYVDEGAVFLYLGTGHGLETRPSWVAYGGCTNAELGARLARVGDVNGDGFDDVVVGEPHWSGKLQGQGRVLVFLGGPHGPRATPDWTFEGDQADDSFGWSVVGVGDLNGDGCADFVVSATDWSGRYANEGRLQLFSGSRTGPPRKSNWTAQGYGTSASLGGGLCLAGDVNGDGHPDLACAAAGYSDGPRNVRLGVVNVFPGTARGLDRRRVWRLVGGSPNTLLGLFVKPLGDFNGDGLADVLVLEPYYPNKLDPDAAGRAFLLLGHRTALPR